jgi:hypothetical protein
MKKKNRKWWTNNTQITINMSCIHVHVYCRSFQAVLASHSLGKRDSLQEYFGASLQVFLGRPFAYQDDRQVLARRCL